MCLEGTFLVILGKVFMAFNKQFTLGFSKRQFRCPGKHIHSFFWEKLWFFHLLSTLTKIFSVFGKKTSPRGVNTAFGGSRWRLWGFFFEINLSVQGSFSRKTFKKLMTFFSNFCNLREKFRTLGEKIQGRVLKITFYVSMRTFWRNNFLEKLIVSQ